MTGEVKHLANNERYRLLIIDGETYIMDIERSFWKIVFPFLFWLLPNYIFKVSDQELVEQLQTERMERKGISGTTAAAGISYAGGMSLAPLINYFDVPMSPLITISLLVLAIILVGLLHFSLIHNRKKKMHNVIEPEALPENKLWVRPSSIKNFLNVLISYIFLLSISVFFFLGYIESRNVMILIIASVILLAFLLVNRKTVREGKATMKFKG